MLSFRAVGVAILALGSDLVTADSPYFLTQNYLPHNLTDGFVFRTAADYPGTGDPTHGFVNYVDLPTATARGLVKVVKGKAGSGAPFSPQNKRNEQLYLGVDHQTILNVSSLSTAAGPGRGRSSLRLESRTTFSSGLLVADFAHMPASQCGVWPAFWAYNFREDPVGEVDILEGVNHQAANMVSLHTGGQCRFTPSSEEDGVAHRDSCTVEYGNASTYGGCGVTAPADANTYGSAFNGVGGGVYATLLEADRLRVWHFARVNVPVDLQQGRPNPSSWGRPLADFSSANGGCDVAANFHSLTVILNTDFCGINQSDGMWSNDAACAVYPSCCAGADCKHDDNAFDDDICPEPNITEAYDQFDISAANSAIKHGTYDDVDTHPTGCAVPNYQLDNAAADGNYNRNDATDDYKSDYNVGDIPDSGTKLNICPAYNDIDYDDKPIDNQPAKYDRVDYKRVNNKPNSTSPKYHLSHSVELDDIHSCHINTPAPFDLNFDFNNNLNVSLDNDIRINIVINVPAIIYAVTSYDIYISINVYFNIYVDIDVQDDNFHIVHPKDTPVTTVLAISVVASILAAALDLDDDSQADHYHNHGACHGDRHPRPSPPHCPRLAQVAALAAACPALAAVAAMAPMDAVETSKEESVGAAESMEEAR
ncbi:hypothetical protein Sste5346_008427 [Sporothrix stenoceras]|uniref:GH16 domain-containing protein n=1 Tax=Sporothrix stenoceras TaxID=5173 RepID=A0ABR3YS05_9PEZI